MSNRSYIFITDNYEGDNVIATGLSEFEDNIPTLYLLLAAYNADAVPSKLFEDEPAIVADFAKGKQLLLDVLKAMAAVYPNDEIIVDFAATTADYFSGLKAKYALLENHEIYVLGEDDYIEQNENIIAMAGSLRVLAEDMVRRYKAGELSHATLTEADKDIIGDIADELDAIEDAGDFWTDTLYYNLSGREGE